MVLTWSLDTSRAETLWWPGPSPTPETRPGHYSTWAVVTRAPGSASPRRTSSRPETGGSTAAPSGWWGSESSTSLGYLRSCEDLPEMICTMTRTRLAKTFAGCTGVARTVRKRTTCSVNSEHVGSDKTEFTLCRKNRGQLSNDKYKDVS